MVTRKSAEKDAPSAEVEATAPDWSIVKDFIDVEAMVNNYGLNVISSAELFGDGATLMEKEQLINVPFKVLEWRMVKDKKTGREYVTVLAMANIGGVAAKIRFNDGSTGVKEQLEKVLAEYGQIVIECRNGLRRSDYTFTNDKGGTEAATTYYLA